MKQAKRQGTWAAIGSAGVALIIALLKTGLGVSHWSGFVEEIVRISEERSPEDGYAYAYTLMP